MPSFAIVVFSCAPN